MSYMCRLLAELPAKHERSIHMILPASRDDNVSDRTKSAVKHVDRRRIGEHLSYHRVQKGSGVEIWVLGTRIPELDSTLTILVMADEGRDLGDNGHNREFMVESSQIIQGILEIQPEVRMYT